MLTLHELLVTIGTRQEKKVQTTNLPCTGRMSCTQATGHRHACTYTHTTRIAACYSSHTHTRSLLHPLSYCMPSRMRHAQIPHFTPWRFPVAEGHFGFFFTASRHYCWRPPSAPFPPRILPPCSQYFVSFRDRVMKHRKMPMGEIKALVLHIHPLNCDKPFCTAILGGTQIRIRHTFAILCTAPKMDSTNFFQRQFCGPRPGDVI